MTTNTTEDADQRQRLERFFSVSRQSILDSIARDTIKDGGLMQNIQSGVQYPWDVFLKHGTKRSDAQLEMQLKDLWWKTIEAAKLYPAEDEGRQYKLVAWIAGAKTRSPVPSSQQDPYVADGGKVL